MARILGVGLRAPRARQPTWRLCSGHSRSSRGSQRRGRMARSLPAAAGGGQRFSTMEPRCGRTDASVQALGTPIHCRTDQEMMPSRKPPPSPTRKSLGRSVRPRARHAPVGPAAPARGARSSGTCRQPLARVPAPRLGGSFLSGAASITMQACPQERRFGNRQPQRLAEPVRGRSTSTTSGLGRGGRSPHCGGATGARSTLRT